MGDLGSSKSSSSTASSVTSLDNQAQGVIGTGADSGSANVRGDSNVTASTGGSSNKTNIGGTQITDAKGNITITSADPAVLQDALARVTTLAEANAAQVNNLAAGAASLFSSSQDKTNAALSSLAQSQQTQGASDLNKNIVYVSIAALAVLGFALYSKRA